MPLLAFNLNDGNEFVFDLTDDRMRLGRAPDNTIIIENSYISSHHAELIRRPDGVYELVDLNSANGVRVNGKRVERIVLNDLDKVAFGQLAGRYYQHRSVTEEKQKRVGSENGSSVVSPKKLEPPSGTGSGQAAPNSPGLLAQL